MSEVSRLLSGRLLASNVVWNLVGTGLPLIVGLWAIPILIDGLGNERFGLLAIIWMGIGYFSLFDLGIGRALTKLIAERLGREDNVGLSQLISVGLRLMAGIGIITAIIVAVITPYLMDHLLQVPDTMREEGKRSFWILAVTLPFVVSTAGFIGILQAHQRFRSISSIRIPLGIINFLAPVFVLPISNSLVATTTALAIARIFAWFGYYILCRNYGRIEKRERSDTSIGLAKKLLSFGGWITVSNVLGPIMVYFDRLLIGSVLGLVAVTYYTTPYEIVTRLWVIPTALADVLFPALATALVINIQRARKIFSIAAMSQMILIFPIVAILILFSKEILELWLGKEFSDNSTEVLRWLVVGVYVNSFARLPFSLLQSYGRPDITAKLHLFELPLYVLFLWLMTDAYGIIGASIAWTTRIGIDTFLLFVFAASKIPEIKYVQYVALMTVSLTTLLLVIMWSADSMFLKIVYLIMIGAVAVLAIYRLIRNMPNYLTTLKFKV